MVEQLLILRRPEEDIISLGPPPPFPVRVDITSLHVPFGMPSLGARSLARKTGTGTILHAWSPQVIGPASKVSEMVNGKAILSLPGLPDNGKLEKLPWIIGSMKAILTLPTGAGVKQGVKLGCNPKLLAVLPPPVSTGNSGPVDVQAVRRHLGVEPGDILLNVPAEMVTGAGHKTTLWSHCILNGSRNNFKLVLPGHGPLRALLRKFSKNIGLHDKVMFTGSKYSMRELAAASDISICCFQKNVGLVGPLAAMAAGNVLVATGLGDMAVICKDGETAAVIPEADSRKFAATILHLADSPDKRAKLGKNARNYVRNNFSNTTARNKLDTIYEFS